MQFVGDKMQLHPNRGIIATDDPVSMWGACEIAKETVLLGHYDISNAVRIYRGSELLVYKEINESYHGFIVPPLQALQAE